MERQNIIENKDFSLTSKKDSLSQDFNNKTCHFCGKTFLYNSSLQKHERIHTGEKPYECDDLNCNQKFSQISNLIRHKKTHEGDQKTFTCKICNKNISSISNLKQHENVHKNSIMRINFFCIIDKCNKNFLYVCTLKKHIQKDHPVQYKSILEYFPGNERNFSVIYKYLISKPDTFTFIKIKNYKKNQGKSMQFSNEDNCQVSQNTDTKTSSESYNHNPQNVSLINSQICNNIINNYNNIVVNNFTLSVLMKYLEYAKSCNLMINPLNQMLNNLYNNSNFIQNQNINQNNLILNDLNLLPNPVVLSNNNINLNEFNNLLLTIANKYN